MGPLLLFGYGLFVGSLVNVLIYRLPRGVGWVKSRSRCESCNKVLQWYELVPVLSWVWLRGKCGGCRKKISVLHPVVELANAVLWGVVGYGGSVGITLAGLGKLGWSGIELVYLITALVLCSILLVILVVDWEHYLIPDEMIIGLLVIGCLLLVVEGMKGEWGMLGERLMAAIIGGLLFWGLHRITRGKGMGWGDVKLVPAMGLILGRFISVGLFAAFLLGSIVGVGLLAIKKKQFGQPVPFGPFLVVGMGIALLWGERIMEWYWGRLGW